MSRVKYLGIKSNHWFAVKIVEELRKKGMDNVFIENFDDFNDRGWIRDKFKSIKAFLIDDGSYSGTQMSAMIKNLKSLDSFQKIESLNIIVNVASVHAVKKINNALNDLKTSFKK